MVNISFLVYLLRVLEQKSSGMPLRGSCRVLDTFAWFDMAEVGLRPLTSLVGHAILAA